MMARLGMAAALVLLLVPAALLAQDTPSKRTPAQIPTDLPPSGYAKGERPPPLERIYEQRTKKVWKALVEILEDDDLYILEKDAGTGVIQTALKSFDALIDPFRDVALAPPKLSWEWPIWQPLHLDQGRYSLEIIVLPDERTRVSIRAYLEGQARHTLEQARFWAERFSNGTIENHYLDRLDKALE